MKLTTLWTCPVCCEQVPIHLDALPGGNQIEVRVPDAALADAFAHGWTHQAEED